MTDAALEDDDFVSIPLGDAAEDEPVPEGEYDITVSTFVRQLSKAGNPMSVAMILIHSDDHENAAPVFEHFVDVLPDDDARTVRFRTRDMARFLTALNIPYDDGGFNPADVPGSTAKVLVKLVQSDLDKDEFVNEIKWPRLPRKAK